MLPLDQSLAEFLPHRKPRNQHWVTNTDWAGGISNGNFRSSSLVGADRTRAGYRRLLLFHRRCFDLVKNLSYSQIYLLIDVVEPTFLDRSLPPATKYGALSSRCSDLCLPRWTKPQLFQRLPPELQDMVLEYDLRRLLFAMRAASQIAARHESLETIPERRFTHEKLFLKDDILRIHSINIGGQIYISHLSDTTGMRRSGIESQDYNLEGSDYLAVKSDGVGVIDIAFRATDARPKWILGSYCCQKSQARISIIRCADVHHLRIIRDVGACI